MLCITKQIITFSIKKNLQQSGILLYRRLDSSRATITQTTITGSHRTEASQQRESKIPYLPRFKWLGHRQEKGKEKREI